MRLDARRRLELPQRAAAANDSFKQRMSWMCAFLLTLLCIAVIECADGDVDARPMRNERIESAIGALAFATLAVGERARAFTATLIPSFVRNGGVECPLVVVTEDSAYFDAVLADLPIAGVCLCGVDDESARRRHHRSASTHASSQSASGYSLCKFATIPTIRSSRATMPNSDVDRRTS